MARCASGEAGRWRGLFAPGYARQAVHYPARLRRILLQFRAPWAIAEAFAGA
jgi:hypothetical protein